MVGYVKSHHVFRLLLLAGGLVLLVTIGLIVFSMRSVPNRSPLPVADGQASAGTSAGSRTTIHATATVDSADSAALGRNVAHPARVSVPIASLGTARDESSPPPQEARILTAATNDVGNVDVMAEPIRSVAPVSSARDEQGQAVDVPLAAVPGAAGLRQGKTPPRPRASDPASEKGK